MAKRSSKSSNQDRVRKWLKNRKVQIFLAVIVLLIALRIALPYILLNYTNKQLANMKGYFGHIDDIDVALLRGGYVIDSIYINKVNDKNGRQDEFFGSKTVDLSIEWRALLKGHIVGELVFDEPKIRFTKDKVELAEVSQDTTSFQELLHDLMPIKVNRTEIRNGQVRYIDNGTSPKVDVAVTNLNAVAHNLRSAYESSEVLPATLDATGNVYKGDLRLGMKLNPLAESSTFDLNAEVKGTDLTEVNDFFQAYGGVDVSKGTFDMFVEVAAKDGQFKGYVKPLIQDLDVVEWKGQDRKDSFFQKIWESLVGGVGKLLENPKKDQVATRINFGGPMRSPNVNVGEAVVTVLQNAFIQALMPSIENKINLTVVGEEDEKKGFFNRLFDKDDKKEDKSDEKKKDKQQADKNKDDKKEKGR